MSDNIRAATLIALAMVLSTVIAAWAFLHAKDLNNTIDITGSYKKRIKSDLIIWRASVVVEAPTLADAYSRLSRDVEKVRAFLVAKKIPESQIVISSVDARPMRKSGRAQEYEGGESGGPITGYHLTQSLQIKSTEIDNITAVSRQVTELINQGILLQSDAPQYLYTKLAEVKVEILAEAAKDALARANQIASSTGSRIGEVRSADMGVLQITSADSTEVTGYGVNDTSSLEKDITAVVHVKFALK